VYVLDATGTRGEKLPASWNQGVLSFDILPEHKSMFFEIVTK